MKRLLTTLLLVICVATFASAQTGLEINKIFNGKYASDPNVSETMMSGEHRYLKSHRLTVLATFKGPAARYAEIVEPKVMADGDKAVGRNVAYRKGKLHFAFFILPPVKDNNGRMNRYLYYLNNAVEGKDDIMVLYFEGPLSEQGAANLINGMNRR